MIRALVQTLILVLIATQLGTSRPALAQSSCSDHVPFGAPLPLSTDSGDRITVCKRDPLRDLAFFVLSYDRARVNPDWVAYHLSRSKMLAVEASDIRRDDRKFRRDPAVETTTFRSPRNKEFKNTRDFDRGHLAPAEVMKWQAVEPSRPEVWPAI